MTNLPLQWSPRKLLIVAVVALVLFVAIGGWRRYRWTPPVATVAVTRTDFVDTLKFRGELKATRSVNIITPANATEFQIVRIAQDGAPIKKGDVVVEFDRTGTEQKLAENRSLLKSVQAEIDQARAQARLQDEQNITAVNQARYDLEAAKLEASKQEIVSRITGEEAKVKVIDAEQKLRKAEQQLASQRVATKAQIEGKKHANLKADYEVRKADLALQATKVLAPQDGVISIFQQWRPDGNRMPLRPGDRAWPGSPIAEIPDLSSLRVEARVEETERGRLREGLPVAVQVDAASDREFNAHIEKVGTLATTDFSAGWPFPRNFILEVPLSENDSRLRPGMRAELSVELGRVPNAIVIPSAAVFDRSGKSIVYLQRGRGFEERVVEVGRRSGDRVLIAKGLEAGDKIALTDPTEVK